MLTMVGLYCPMMLWPAHEEPLLKRKVGTGVADFELNALAEWLE